MFDSQKSGYAKIYFEADKERRLICFIQIQLTWFRSLTIVRRHLVSWTSCLACCRKMTEKFELNYSDSWVLVIGTPLLNEQKLDTKILPMLLLPRALSTKIVLKTA